MHRLRTALYAAAAVAAPLLVMAPAPAQAACCVAYDYEDIKGREKNIISTLGDKINAMQLAIIEAMRLGTGQLSGNAKEGMATDSNIANVQDDRAVTRSVEQVRFEALKESQSAASGCTVITGATSAGALSTGAANFSSRTVDDLVRINMGEPGSPAAAGSDVFINRRIKKHCSLFAGQSDVNSGLCSSAVSEDMRLASVNVADSIFYQPQGQAGMTLSKERMDAANAFMANAFVGRPLGPMLPGEARTPGGIEKAAERQTQTSLQSIAQDSAATVLAFRAPQKNSELAGWINSTGAKVAGYRNDTVKDGQASYADYMDVTSKNWFFNADAMTKANGFNESAALKEIMMMEAFQAYLGWQSYKLQEKQVLTLAGILTILAGSDTKTVASR